jgi:hypothetical protein
LDAGVVLIDRRRTHSPFLVVRQSLLSKTPNRGSIMKQPKVRIPADEPLPFSLKGLVLFPTILSLTIAVETFVLSIGHGPDGFPVAGFISLLCAVAFYSATFMVGGLCLIPWLLRRFLKRLTGPRRRSPAPDRDLWDDSIDSP